MLRIAHVIAQTYAEGPGCRLAIWVQGCSLRCPSCCNPELFGRSGGAAHSTAQILNALTPDCEGISVLGGEPLDQAEGVASVCEGVRARGGSVMVFTGYTLESLRARGDPQVDRVLATTDLLVDGPYLVDQPDTRRRWIGSANQRLHFLSAHFSTTDPRFLRSNTVELRLDGDTLTVNGWPLTARLLHQPRAR